LELKVESKILQAWKKLEAKPEVLKTVVGEPLSESEMLKHIAGGFDPRFTSGMVLTISGECNGGTSCSPF